MRRIALLVAVGLLVTAAAAWAVTNTVSYSVTIKKVGGNKATPKKPLRIAYNAVLHIDTDPPGSQPETSPVTSIYFPSQIQQNSKLLPSCKQSDIDGKQSMPAKCNKAVVGSGTASALAGSPGSPASNSVKEDLNVKFLNGGPNVVLLLLNSQPSAPVAITNRVVPGTLGTASAPFGYRVDFTIPQDLQNQLGLSIALTDFKVSITNKAFTVKKGKKKVQVGYLQLTGCPASGTLPIRAVAHFASGDVTNDSTTKC